MDRHWVLFPSALLVLAGCMPFQDEQEKFSTQITDLQFKLSETQAVANNVPLFREQVAKTCKGKEAIKRLDEIATDKTQLPRVIPLPEYYERVPEFLKKADLVARYRDVVTKLRQLEPVVRQVEYYKGLQTECLALRGETGGPAQRLSPWQKMEKALDTPKPPARM
jgi:hypothetical protein